MADLEDLAGPAKQPAARADASAASAANAGSIEPKQMLSSPLRAALSKQGYKLVGAVLAITLHTQLLIAAELTPWELAVTSSRIEPFSVSYLERVLPNSLGALFSCRNPRSNTVLLTHHLHRAGSHSGVKLCRWTKSMLRGRGGCYKHAFYGIESHRCMEATPSLACANKCVFCWRHHTNPGLSAGCAHLDEPFRLLPARHTRPRVYGCMARQYENLQSWLAFAVPGQSLDHLCGRVPCCDAPCCC